MSTTKKTTFQTVTDHGLSYWLVLAVLAGVTGVGFLAAYYMEHRGHYVTGMNNHIVWGLPHVFAIFLIVAASGALNVASIGSVFGKIDYSRLGACQACWPCVCWLGALACWCWIWVALIA